MSDSEAAPLAGLYRGTVVSDQDPQQRPRVQVDVGGAGLAGAWAEVAGPLDGDPVVPPVTGSSVWVMFEQGMTDRPVVVGLLTP